MGNCRSKKQDPADCNNLGHTSHGHAGDNQNNNIASYYNDCESKARFSNHVNLNSTNPGGACANNCSMMKSGSSWMANRSSTRSPNETVIESTRAEVALLLEGINTFQGSSQDDKTYKYYDEMLTRCILSLDQIECESQQDRCNRKEAIGSVNQAINILERKLAINTEIKSLENELQR